MGMLFGIIAVVFVRVAAGRDYGRIVGVIAASAVIAAVAVRFAAGGERKRRYDC